MKRLFIFTLQLLALVLFVGTTVIQTVPGASDFITGVVGYGPTILLFGAGTSGISVAMATWLADLATTDPQLFHKWSKLAIKQGEQKTEFTESEIGTTWGDDGPKPSQLMPASPIVYSSQLEKGGKYLDIPIRNPLVTGTSAILNTGRYEGQTKVGAEQTLSRHNFRAAIDSWSLPVGESQIVEGIQYTANMSKGELMAGLVDAITDHEAQRKDTGMWFAAVAGMDIHHYLNAGLRAGLSDGDNLVADTKNGVMSVPREHGNLYVWHTSALNKVAYNATVDTYEDSITAEISLVDGDDTPTLDMLRQISRKCKNTSMIPCIIKDNNGKSHKKFFVYIPGGVRDLLEGDTDFKALMNSAYQGSWQKNPLIQDDDIVWKNLIIRDSVKLDEADEDYFTAKNSFNAIGTASTDTTKMTYNVATSGGVTTVSLTPGVRQFTSATAATTAFGQGNTQVLKRIFVFGAGALVRAVGKHEDLKYKKEDDYESIAGVSKTCLFGQSRVEKWNTDGTYNSTPQSFEVLCLGEAV